MIHIRQYSRGVLNSRSCKLFQMWHISILYVFIPNFYSWHQFLLYILINKNIFIDIFPYFQFIQYYILWSFNYNSHISYNNKYYSLIFFDKLLKFWYLTLNISSWWYNHFNISISWSHRTSWMWYGSTEVSSISYYSTRLNYFFINGIFFL